MTELTNRILDRVYLHRFPVLVLLQIAIIVASNQAAFWLRFDGEVPPAQQPFDLLFLPLLIAVRLAVFFPLRLHEGVWRYASVWDLRNILLGVTASTVVFWIIVHGIAGATLYPRSVFIIDAILLICMMGGVRLARRLYVSSLRKGPTRRVLVYGAGDAGELIVRDMLQNARYQSTPIGFVDDDPSKAGQRIHGVPVLGTRRQLEDILRRHAPDELLIAIPSGSRETLRTIVRALEPHRIRITTLPRLQDLMSSPVEMDQIRQLNVEDLLARDPVGLDYAPVRQFLEGKRILVTGAGGSIGSELCRQILSARPASLAMVDRYENGLFHIHKELANSRNGSELHPLVADVTDAHRLDQLFGQLRPQIVFHAAAHKHVPLMEDNPCEAIKNNVRGTRIVAETAVRHDVERFVLISTDKAVNPTSVMGATKRVAELIVDALNFAHGNRFTSVRFGNVIGSNGSVVPAFLAQVQKGGPVTVTHPEMRRFFMLIPEAVQLVLHAASLRGDAPLFVLEMGEQIKVVDLARDLIRLAGYVPDKDIAIEFTGIRPGEKLLEVLVGEGESCEPSSVDKIMRVRTVAPRCQKGLLEAIGRLEALALEGRRDEAMTELSAILSTFTQSGTQAAPA